MRKYLLLLVLAGCGDLPPLDPMPPPCEPTVHGALMCPGDGTRVRCTDHGVAVVGCMVEHMPTSGVVQQAECVEACR